MSRSRRLALLALACVAGLLLGAVPAGAAPGGPADRAAAGGPEWTGTYQRVAQEVPGAHGRWRHAYDDVLAVGERTYRLRLPDGVGLRGGTPVRVRGRLVGNDLTAEQVTALGAPAAPATKGTTKVLVVLAYWTSPDSMTVAKARDQVFKDDHGWFSEASYGQLGLTGDATGWHKILAPTGGQCYTNHGEIMERAKAKAKAAGFDSAAYDRTIVYFPSCAAPAAGWAYQPGFDVWLNGFFDRRVSVHEQGHNYGLSHASSYSCLNGTGEPVTLSGTCSTTEYGDDYDAMGASDLVAHFSAAQKDRLGWLGSTRKKVVTSSSPFTLQPLEKASSTLVAAVTSTSVSTRRYWMEHRQPVGYDGDLPPGATNGVMVRMTDSAVNGADGGPLLLDMSPHNGLEHVVVPAGGAWTSPEGVRISVGTVTSSGAVVTVTTGAGQPTAPGAPTDVAATGGDESVRLTWAPPASNGGATVQSYEVTGAPGSIVRVVDGTETSTTVPGLVNGTQYSFTVKARNTAGTGPASSSVVATPTAQLPNVSLTAPVAGTTVTGPTTMRAAASPSTTGGAPVDGVSFEVDGSSVGWDSTSPYSATWDPAWLDDGEHLLTATAYDENGRYRTSSAVAVTVANPRPTVAITSPSAGAVVTEDVVALSATSAPMPGGPPVQWVSYALVREGEPDQVVAYGDAAAPHAASWDTSALDGPQTLVATVYDGDGRSGRSAPVQVTVQRPLPTVAVTSPAEGAQVRGTVTLEADPQPNATSQSPIGRVDFLVDDLYVGTAYSAPWTLDWQSGDLVGEHVVSAVAVDQAGREGTSLGRSIVLTNPVPSVSITSPAPGAEVRGTVSITAAAAPHPETSSAVVSVDVALDGWSLETFAGPGPHSVPWDPGDWYGPHTVEVTAVDAAGRTGRSTVSFTVPFPTPEVGITSPSDGALLLAGTQPFALDVAPDPRTPGNAVTSAALLVDGEEVGYDSTPGDGFGGSWQAEPGDHVLTARVWDSWGYVGESAPVAVRVADVPGIPTSVTAVAGNGQVTVSWTPPAGDGGSAVTGYVVRSDKGVEQPATASPLTVSGLTNGTLYSFTVAAVNGVGRGPASLSTGDVRPEGPDTTAPTAVIASGPPTHSRSGSAVFSLSGTDPGRPWAAFTFRCSVDSTTLVDCATPVSFSALADGLHTFRVVARDESGNASPVLSRTWRIDRVAPTVSTTAPPSYSVGASVGLAYSGSDTGGGVSSYDVRYRVAPWYGTFGSLTYPSSWQGTTAKSVSRSAKAGNTYCFSVRARDKAGNRSAWSTERCTAVALDDRALSPTSGPWTAGTSSSYYAGTVMTTATKGATLTRTSVQTKRIALVATRCSGCGTVGVYFDGVLVKQVSLAASTTAHRSVISIGTFSSVRSGTVTVKNLDGRTTRVDGIAFRRV